MNKFLSSLALVAALSFSASAFGDLLAEWTFEVSIPTTAGPHASEGGFPGGSALGGTGGTYSNPVGNGSPESFSSNGWDVGDYYQFTTSTVGYEDVTLSWAQTSSNTGPKDFKVAYSTDGSIFTDAPGGAYVVGANLNPPGFWSSGTPHPEYDHTLSLAAVSALDNQATIWIRLVNTTTVAANSFDPVAATGTDRVDNVKIEAAEIPEPASLALLGLGSVVMLARRRSN